MNLMGESEINGLTSEGMQLLKYKQPHKREHKGDPSRSYGLVCVAVEVRIHILKLT